MREMMRALRLFLSGLGAGLTSLTQAVTFVDGFGMTDPEAYLAGFRRLAFFFAAFPLPLLLMGAFLANKWVIAAAGILWAIETLILFLAISPLAYLITALLNKKVRRVVDPEMGRRYVTTALTVVFYELLISFFLFLIPIHTNPKILIILVMTATILALAGMTWLRKIMVGVALGTFAFYTLALLAPGVAGELAEIPELAGARAEKEIACAKDENSLKCREFRTEVEKGKPIAEDMLNWKKQEIIATPGGWTEIHIPDSHDFNIEPHRYIPIEQWDGKAWIQVNKPGKPTSLGNLPSDLKFRVRSEGGEIPVVVWTMAVPTKRM